MVSSKNRSYQSVPSFNPSWFSPIMVLIKDMNSLRILQEKVEDPNRESEYLQIKLIRCMQNY